MFHDDKIVFINSCVFIVISSKNYCVHILFVRKFFHQNPWPEYYYCRCKSCIVVQVQNNNGNYYYYYYSRIYLRLYYIFFFISIADDGVVKYTVRVFVTRRNAAQQVGRGIAAAHELPNIFQCSTCDPCDSSDNNYSYFLRVYYHYTHTYVFFWTVVDQLVFTVVLRFPVLNIAISFSCKAAVQII